MVSHRHMKVAGKGVTEVHFAFHLVAMAIVVDVTLISGQRVSLEADLTASVQSLVERARRALGVGRGRLFTSFGSVLDGDSQLGAAKLQTGKTQFPYVVAFSVSRQCRVMSLLSQRAMHAMVVTAVPCKIS